MVARLSPLIGLLLAACVLAPNAPGQRPTPATFFLTSTSFGDGDAIPMRLTCHGDDRSPQVGWKGAPAGTTHLALLVRDADANDFVHWLAWDIPIGGELAEGASPQLPAPAVEGSNDFGRIGWGGPCPPAGTPHDYVFTIYALPAPLGQPADASVEDVESAARSAALAAAGYRGTYGR